MKQLQQGDVTITRVESLPKDAALKPREHGHVILAHGEVTGHFHGIKSHQATLHEHAGKIYLNALKKVTLRHQEHKPITIDPGVYEIGRVQEYDYLQQISRPVAD